MRKFTVIWMVVSVVLLIGCGGVRANEEELFAQAKQLQEQGKLTDAVVKYEEVVKSYPKGTRAPQAQFMVGFLYANEVRDLAKAKSAYEKFLKEYAAVSDSGIIASANFELKNLGKSIDEIPELKHLAPPDSINTK